LLARESRDGDGAQDRDRARNDKTHSDILRQPKDLRYDRLRGITDTRLETCTLVAQAFRPADRCGRPEGLRTR